MRQNKIMKLPQLRGLFCVIKIILNNIIHDVKFIAANGPSEY